MADPACTLPLTDVDDGLTHAVTDEAFATGQGRYSAICGAEVCPAAATVPLGPACPGCLRILRRATDPVYVDVPAQWRGRHRHRRPGRLQVLLGARGVR